MMLILIFFILGIVIGLFLFFKPILAIEFQKKFYENINWRIEPISMKKEIRNTKLMGLFLIVIIFLTISYMLISPLYFPVFHGLGKYKILS